MEKPAKRTVTSLSSLFPAEEVQEASKRVQDTISGHQKELDQVQDFVADNASLISLVQKLPEELHHDIMVLLGEGYYVERTSKHTIDLLKRRGKALESQVKSIKAVMQDLKAQASYFDATAAEVAEGLVEITEEYTAETSAELSKADPTNASEADNINALTEEEAFAKLMSKIDELEKEELAEESDEDDDGYSHMMSKLDELEKKELATESVSGSDKDYSSQPSLDQRHGHQLPNPTKQSTDEYPIIKELPSIQHAFPQELHKQFEGSKLQSVSEGKSPSDPSSALAKSSLAEKASVLPEVEENIEAKPQSQYKAFTGSIVEHTHNLETNPREQTSALSKSSAPQPSKPVSRFKMQRR